MEQGCAKFQILNGNMLKLIGLVSMTLDHFGFICFPDILIFRIIGRLALPIFSYMIAEGCYYTKNKLKYVLSVFIVGVICQLVYGFMDGSLYMCIMITFTCSILIIYCLQKAFPQMTKEWDENKESESEDNFKWKVFTLIAITIAAFLTLGVPIAAKLSPVFAWLVNRYFYIDYGFFGIMLPVVIYIPRVFIKESAARLRIVQSIVMFLWLIPVSMTSLSFQWYSLLAVIPMLLYNGKRGKLKLKYLFYIFYPLHLAAIFIIFGLATGTLF